MIVDFASDNSASCGGGCCFCVFLNDVNNSSHTLAFFSGLSVYRIVYLATPEVLSVSLSERLILVFQPNDG